MKEKRQETRFRCLFCGKGFRTNFYLEIHMNEHTKEEPFRCQECDATFGDYARLNLHRKKQHPNRKMVKWKRTVKTCLFCGKWCRTYWHLEMHMNVHTGEKTFQCSECEEGFSSLSSLHQHRDKHHLGIRFECNVCLKKSTTLPNLKHHQKRAHGGVGGWKKTTMEGFGGESTKVEEKKADKICEKTVLGVEILSLEEISKPTGDKLSEELPSVENCDTADKVSSEVPKDAATPPTQTQLITSENGIARDNTGKSAPCESSTGLTYKADKCVIRIMPSIKRNDMVKKASEPSKKLEFDPSKLKTLVQGLARVGQARKVGGTDYPLEEERMTTAAPSPRQHDNHQHSADAPAQEEVPSCQLNVLGGNEDAAPLIEAEKEADLSLPPQPPVEVWEDPIAKIIASLDLDPPKPPPPPNLPKQKSLSSKHRPLNPNNPCMVIVDPVTKMVKPLASATAPVVPLLHPSQTPTMFFCVNGKINMPVFGLPMLRHIAKTLNHPRPTCNPSSSEEEEELEPVKLVKPKKPRKPVRPAASTPPAAKKGGASIKRYKCTLCGSRFLRACHLATHLKHHRNTESGSFPCSFCTSSYNTSEALIYHIYVQHKVASSKNSFGCPYCLQTGKKVTFSEKSKFIQHLRVHRNQDQKYVTSEITPTAATLNLSSPRGNLALVPKQKKPEKMSRAKGIEFGKQFVNKPLTKNSKKLLLLKHSRPRAYPCPFCQKRFYTPFLVARHISQIHSSSKNSSSPSGTYPCPFTVAEAPCANFETQHGLTLHITRNHKDKLNKVPEQEGPKSGKLAICKNQIKF